jgi:LacI family transcriptional regulator
MAKHEVISRELRGEIAEVAFRAMREGIRVPTTPMRTLMVAPRLVVRESCGAYLR